MMLALDHDKRMAIERVIAKLHVASNPNSKAANDEIELIIDTFWKEFGRFRMRMESMVRAQEDFFSKMHCTVIHICGMNFTHCLTPVFLVLLLVMSPQKNLE